MPRRRRKDAESGDGEDEGKGVEASGGGAAPADVFRVSFYKVKKANALVRRLQVAHTALGGVDQEERPGEIERVGQLLATDSFVKHSNKDVRLLTACALVDILRVFAPDAPFDDDVVLLVFDLIVSQLRSLGKVDGPHYDRCLYILDSLATVKTCNALVDIAQGDLAVEDDEETAHRREQAHDVLVELFDVLLSRVSEGHSSKVVEHITDIIAACIEDMQSVSVRMLDCLLYRLVAQEDDAEQDGDTADSDPACSAAVVTSVIRRCVDRLHSVISQFVVQALTDTSSDTGLKTRSSMEVVHDLVVQLNNVDPQLLLNILPVVCEQLQIQDKNMRYSAVELLSKLFLSDQADLPGLYATNFAEFLKRFTDSDVDVRKLMVQFAGDCLVTKPELDAVIEGLHGRLADPSADVREQVVDVVSAAAQQDAVVLTAVPTKLIVGVTERMQDRQVTVRVAAMTGLAKMYSRHLSLRWDTADGEGGEEPELTQDMAEKLVGVPGSILLCFAFKDPRVRLRIVQLLDSVLVPKNLSPEGRAKGLLQIYLNLTSEERTAFRLVLDFRKQVQTAVLRFLALHERARSDRSPAAQTAAMDAAAKLAKAVPGSADNEQLFRSLHKVADQRVFKSMAGLVNCATPSSALYTFRDDVLSRLASEPTLHTAIKPLLRHMTMYLAPSDVMTHFLHLITDYDEGELAADAGELLVALATRFPGVFDGVHKQLSELTGTTVESTKTASLNALAAVAPRFRVVDGSPRIASSMKKHLAAVVLDGSPVQAKCATRAMCLMAPSAAAPAAWLAKKLVTEDVLSADNDNVESVLRALATLAVEAPSAFLDHSLTVAQFALQDVLKGPQAPKERRARGTVSSDASCRVAATKVLVNIARGIIKEKPHDNEAKLAGNMCINNLIKILKSDGNVPGAPFELNSTDRAAMRKAAAGGLLRLVRCSRFDQLLSPTGWHELGWMVQDDDKDVRAYVLRKVYDGLTKRPASQALGVRYLAYFALAAHDSDVELRRTVRTYLLQAASHKHLLHMRQAKKARASSAGAGASAAAHRHMPEYCLPFAIHLLAHHPGFDEAKLAPPTQQLTFLLNGLLSLSQQNKNLAFMNHLLQRIRGCVDVLAPKSRRTHLLAEVAQRALHKRVVHDHNMIDYVGDVFVPRPFFRPSSKALKLGPLLPSAQAEHASPTKKRSSPVKRKSPARAGKARRQSANSTRSPGAVAASSKVDDAATGSDELRRATRRSSRSSARLVQKGMYAEVGSDGEGETGAGAGADPAADAAMDGTLLSHSSSTKTRGWRRSAAATNASDDEAAGGQQDADSRDSDSDDDMAMSGSDEPVARPTRATARSLRAAGGRRRGRRTASAAS